jgi:hypothetical protein
MTMSIDPNEAHSTDEWVLRCYDDELDADRGIAAARRAVENIDTTRPVVPSGGRTERAVKPQVARAKSLRDRVRVWAPGIAGTAGVTALVIDPAHLPLTAPLTIYGIGWGVFGWWTAAGRPGPVEAGRMLAYTVTDHYAHLRVRVARLSERRSVYEARRTVVRPVRPAAEGR